MRHEPIAELPIPVDEILEFHLGLHLGFTNLEERYGKSRVTLWRWVRAGLLPAPYRTGPNSVDFDAEEIEARDAGLERCAYAPVEA